MTHRLLSGRSRVRIAPGPPQTLPRISDLREAWIPFEPRIERQCARFRDDSRLNLARTNRLAEIGRMVEARTEETKESRRQGVAMAPTSGPVYYPRDTSTGTADEYPLCAPTRDVRTTKSRGGKG